MKPKNTKQNAKRNMPTFSDKSKKYLSECHPDLQVIFNEVIKHFDCSVICGHRGAAEQNAAYEQGMSKVQFPNSKHNKVPAMAVDVVPYPVDWNDRERMYFFAGHVIAIAKKLKELGWIKSDIRWGGDWNQDTDTKKETFKDLPHFEII